MEHFKERIVQEIVSLGRKNRRLRMPAIVLAAFFLVTYHIVREFFLQFRKHPAIQRGISGILIMALLAEQIGTLTVSAGTYDGAAVGEAETVISAFLELPGEVREQSVPVGTTLETLVLPDILEAAAPAKEDIAEETTAPEETASQGETAPEETVSSGDLAAPEENTASEPVSEAVTMEGITWTSLPEFDGQTAGEYIFTAVLPEGYVPAEGISLPQIAVTVIGGEQKSAPRISGWHFDEEHVAPKGDLLYDAGSYSLVLAGGSSEVQIPFEDIISVFPESVTVEYADQETDGIGEKTLSVLGWSCPEYAADEEGSLPYSGSFFFTALLGEDGEEKEYALSEGVGQIGVWVIFDAPMTLSAVTPSPGTITADQEWGEGSLAAGTYTIEEGVTVTVSGRLTVDGAVTINGGGKLVRASSYEGSDNNYGRYSALFLVSVSTSTLTLENITIDGNSVNAYGPAVYITDGAVVNMNSGAVIQNNYNMNSGETGSYAGGGIYCGSSSTLNINGGTIKNCKTEGTVGYDAYAHAGGGIYLKGICNMTSGSITGNSASNGGGIYLASGAALSLTGGAISGNQVNGEGSGIYYSTKNNATGKLSIGGDTNVSDTIFLDITTGTLYPQITSKLNYKITLKCNSAVDGKILAEGSGYTLTGVDASKISMENTNLYSRLDAANNQIVLSTTEEVEAKWQESSGGAWKTGKFTTALKNVYSGGTIQLMKDVVLTKKAEITKAVTITSENPANPYTITRMTEDSQNYGDIALTGSGSLTLTDVIYDGNKDAYGGAETSLIEVGAGAALTLGSGCTIRNGGRQNGSGVISVSGTMTMEDGTVIELCSAADGGTVWIAPAGEFTMNGGTIQKCTAGRGSVISSDGSCILNGGVIKENSNSYSRAVYLGSGGSGSLTLNGVTIQGNDYSVYNEGKRVSVAGDSDLDGVIYTTNAIVATGDGVSGLTKTYTIGMSSFTEGTTVVEGSSDSTHYRLDHPGYELIPASSGTNLTAAVKNEKYAVTYHENGGTIANKDNYTSYTKGRGLTLPRPERTGYTFKGWYESASFAGSAVESISTSATGAKTYYAKWTADSYTVTFNYQGATGGNTQASQKVTYDGTYGTLPSPSKTGCTFMGWYTEAQGGGSKVTSATAVTITGAQTLYAYWLDQTAPDKPVLQSGVTLPTGWTHTQKTIPLALNDGVAVTELWVSFDKGNYKKVDGFSSGSRSYSYPVSEGQHTYQFYAKDAAGNTSAASNLFTVKLDTVKPEITELTYENKAADLWGWIIGKKSLVIGVTVSDDKSGVTQISYTMTPVKADGTPDSSGEKTKTASVTGGRADISFAEDFKGTIRITCTDGAGNSSDSVTVNTSGGVIVEDNAPKIGFSANGGEIAESYYDTAPDILVSVTDDQDDAGSSRVTGGIASVTYQVGSSGAEKNDGKDYTASMVPSSSFTVPAREISTGETTITVKVRDHAGNTAEKSVTVRVKGAEARPAAGINYGEETLTGLVANAEYTINHTGKTADGNGAVSIEEGWFDTQISIIKKGNQTTTFDSDPQTLKIPARPEAPTPVAADYTDTRITLQTIANAEYRMDNGSWQSGTAFSGLTAKTKYTFEAYYPATANSFRSLAGSAVIATRPAAPDVDSGSKDLIKIDYEKETFSFPAGGVEIFQDAACTRPIDPDSIGKVTDYIGGTIYIRYPADGDFPASEAVPVSVKGRPAAPASIGCKDETYPNAGDGAITGLSEGTAYEISSDGGNTWKDAVLSGTRIEGLAPGSYQVRVKAGEESFSGEPSRTITIGTTKPAEETKPQAGVGYDTGALTGLVPGEKYEVTYTTQDGEKRTQECIADKDGNIRFEEDWYGKTIEVVKAGNGEDKADSEAQSLTVPARPEAPASIGCKDETYPNAGDGAITGLSEGTAYEISSDGGNTWKDAVLSGTRIEGLAPGSYQVRVKAGEENFSGEPSGTITIGTTKPAEEEEPQAGIGYDSDTLTGLVPGGKYEVTYTTQDGAERTQECIADKDGNIRLEEDWYGKTIKVVKAGNDKDKADSEAQSLTVPARPKTPEPNVAGEGGSGQNNGCITNLIPGETYQLSTDGGITWKDVTADKDGQIKNLAPGSYEIRVKPTDNTFCSESVKFHVTASGSESDDSDGSAEENSGTGNKPGTGNDGMIRKEVEKRENVPDTKFSMTTDELAAIVLTDDERKLVKDGTDIKILLTVEEDSDNVSGQDKAEMDQAKGKFEVGQYLDINLLKIIGDSEEKITETKGMIRITIDVPDNLKNKNRAKTREFAVIRLHDGEAVILKDLDTNEDTVTIETNLFSPYALLYRDVAGKDGAKDDEPKTGDNTHRELYATAGMIAGFAYLLRYFGDGKCGMTEEEKKEIISKIIRWAHRGGKVRRNLALVAVFLLLVYYHSIGKKVAVKWNEVYGMNQ